MKEPFVVGFYKMVIGAPLIYICGFIAGVLLMAMFWKG